MATAHNIATAIICSSILFLGCGGDEGDFTSQEGGAGNVEPTTGNTGNSETGNVPGTGNVGSGNVPGTGNVLGTGNVAGTGSVATGNTGNTVCTPKTCQEIGRELVWSTNAVLDAGVIETYNPTACGVVDDGCGHQIDCGTSCGTGASCGSRFLTELPDDDFFVLYRDSDSIAVSGLCGTPCIVYGNKINCDFDMRVESEFNEHTNGEFIAAQNPCLAILPGNDNCTFIWHLMFHARDKLMSPVITEYSHNIPGVLILE